ATLPGDWDLAHAIRLGIKPFAELGANSQALSGSQVDSPCSCRAIFESAPVAMLQSQQLSDSAYSVLERPVPPIKTVPRQRPPRHKARIVQERGFETIHTLEEMVAEFDYQPVACDRDYRLIVLRKKLAIEECGSVRS